MACFLFSPKSGCSRSCRASKPAAVAAGGHTRRSHRSSAIDHRDLRRLV
jgi:hypothetical protein